MSARSSRRTTLSVMMIVRDEGDRIEASLQSVVGWASEIIVLDSGSTDGTIDIVSRYTDKLWVTDWPGYGPQRNRALNHCSGDWVLSIDADEVVTPELRDEIDRVLDESGCDFTVLKMPWKTFLFGRPLKHGRYTSPQAKLFRREGARYRDHQVHESLMMPRRKERVLNAPLEHYSWRNYQHVQEKHLKYGCLLAAQKFANGRRGSLAYAALRFGIDFLQQYLVRGGFLDGSRGFLMAVILGQYAFHKYAALWALEAENTMSSRKP
ncbi:glycosyltransferase family 2 protein [Aquariibacter albus]|uniref:Glycosyltransferase family 2 protein n=1 Tax=Aquariibacter albus TaxID=2759899 RepID=A0A839HS74_9BURK|nr:glycosyltransferase family 2 protein [Aquariibacter albus]MBB1160664.1 glycosyltransferase family 2 protein [Aquariibacter albus]